MASTCFMVVISTDPWADLTLLSHAKCWFVAFYKAVFHNIEETYGYIKIAIEIRGVIEIFVDLRDKINTLHDRSQILQIFLQSYSRTTTKHLLCCANDENKDTIYLIVHDLCNLRLRYFENCTTISTFIEYYSDETSLVDKIYDIKS